MATIPETQERIRLLADRNRSQYWKRWGPYLSDRQRSRCFPCFDLPFLTTFVDWQ